jgi:hypothetical protein
VRNRWFATALLTSGITALALLLLPTVMVHEGSGPVGGGQNAVTDRMVSLWQDQPGIAFVLAIPVLLCALPLLVPPRPRQAVAWVSVTALGAFALLGLPSVGAYFLPALILMAIGTGRLGRSDSSSS